MQKASTALKGCVILRFDSRSLAKRVLRRYVVGGIAGLAVFSVVINGSVHADPADDGVAKLNELSRQAEQLTESMHSAQLDLDKKLQVQAVAEKKHTDDLANRVHGRSKGGPKETLVRIEDPHQQATDTKDDRRT